MRTKIDASWIVGNNGTTHTLIRDGVVVFEDNRIIHVGKAFDGDVDRTLSAPASWSAPASSTPTSTPGTAPRTG